MKVATTSQRLNQIISERHIRQIDIIESAKPFSEKYGVKLNKNDLSQYVNGKTEPGQEKLTILGLTLNVNEAWLMGYDVPMERAQSGTPQLLETKKRVCSRIIGKQIQPIRSTRWKSFQRKPKS